uniref:RBR-type E3 ubiquitin transferase n=1 Tax=Parasteatoda tepidariorum TaxID=114398 RepID=A0A2L2YRV2_PARTP
MDHIHFLLDCFVVSAGSEPPQLGRYHPQSDPEEFVEKEVPRYRVMSPDDMIVRELSEMRMVLERLMENHPKEVGEFYECGICFDSQWLYRRSCCYFPVCSNCLQIYLSFKINNGLVKIECCNTECNVFVHRDEISVRLNKVDKDKFNKLLVLANQDLRTKTCPRCSHLTKKHKKDNHFPNITCPSCHLEWCFNCHAPWHDVLTSKQFQKGDRLLRSWAKERNHGQLNAQKCPKCKIYIQRTTGCDHMHCTRCKTDFCYKCGERFRYLKFFGDHYSKLSIFGCRYRFKADQPLQRKMIRGALFGGKVIAAPVLGTLAFCAGALAVGISLFALPVYGGVCLYRHCKGRQTIKILLDFTPTCYIPK